MKYCVNICGNFKRLAEMQDSINRALLKIYEMLYSALRKRFATIWMDFKNIIQSESSQIKKDKYCMIFQFCVISKKK